MELSSYHATFTCVDSHVVLNNLFSDTHKRHSFYNIIDQVSHKYETEISGYKYITIDIGLDKGETDDSDEQWQEFPKFNPLVIKITCLI